MREGFILNPDGFKYILHPASCWQSLACSPGAQPPAHPLTTDSYVPPRLRERGAEVWARAEDLPK